MSVTAEQYALVINEFALAFRNKLTIGDLFTWKKHDGEMDDTNGLQVIEQVRPRYNVYKTSEALKDLTSGVDGTAFGGEVFEITDVYNVNMGWSDFAKIQTIGDARESEAIDAAAQSLAEKVDADGLMVAMLGANNWVNSTLTNVDEQIEAVLAYTRLKEEGVSDGGMNFVMNHMDEALLGDQVVKLAAPDSFATQTYKRGYDSTISGINALFTNQLGVIVNGTRAATGAAQVNGAAQNVNYRAVAKAVLAKGNGFRLTQELILENAGNAVTFKKGEVFTIPGVFAYDNRKQALVQPARLQQFTVCEDATASAGGAVTLTIFPAIIVPGSGSGEDIAINTAQATVSAAPANDAVLTFVGAPSTVYSPRLLIQKQAIVANTKDLVMPANTPDARRRRLPDIPLSVRMWPHSSFNTADHGIRFDTVINFNLRERRRIARFNGAPA